jgi:hypothetical protein
MGSVRYQRMSDKDRQPATQSRSSSSRPADSLAAGAYVVAASSRCGGCAGAEAPSGERDRGASRSSRLTHDALGRQILRLLP